MPMRGNLLSEADLLERAHQLLGARLDDLGWHLEIGESPRPEIDAVLRFTAPDGRTGRLLIELKSDAAPRAVREGVRRIDGEFGSVGLLLVAPYLSPRTREWLSDDGVNYLDLTGNIRIALREPALALIDRGSDRDPFPRRGPRRGLSGSQAGRVVLSLSELRPPMTLTELAEVSGVSISYVSRLVSLLHAEDLVDRTPRGPITAVDRPGLIRRWAEDYSLLESNEARLYLDPRGPNHTLRSLGSPSVQRSLSRHAVTGSFAAHRLAPVAPPTKLACYVDHPDSVAAELGLTPATARGNVFLLQPYDSIVFERIVEGTGVAWATAAQVAVDCLTGVDRMPEEGEALLAHLTRTQEAWGPADRRVRS